MSAAPTADQIPHHHPITYTDYHVVLGKSSSSPSHCGSHLPYLGIWVESKAATNDAYPAYLHPLHVLDPGFVITPVVSRCALQWMVGRQPTRHIDVYPPPLLDLCHRYMVAT